MEESGCPPAGSIGGDGAGEESVVALSGAGTLQQGQTWNGRSTGLILVVHDDEAIRQVAGRMLATLGCRATCAGNAAQDSAREVLAASAVGLVPKPYSFAHLAGVVEEVLRDDSSGGTSFVAPPCLAHRDGATWSSPADDGISDAFPRAAEWAVRTSRRQDRFSVRGDGRR